MDYIALGRRIRHYRHCRGLTQQRLAEMVEISPSFMGHIERGARTASLETVIRLCRALQVTPNDLLGATASMPSEQTRVTVSPERLLQEIALLLEKEENS